MPENGSGSGGARSSRTALRISIHFRLIALRLNGVIGHGADVSEIVAVIDPDNTAATMSEIAPLANRFRLTVVSVFVRPRLPCPIDLDALRLPADYFHAATICRKNQIHESHERTPSVVGTGGTVPLNVSEVHLRRYRRISYFLESEISLSMDDRRLIRISEIYTSGSRKCFRMLLSFSMVSAIA